VDQNRLALGEVAAVNTHSYAVPNATGTHAARAASSPQIATICGTAGSCPAAVRFDATDDDQAAAAIERLTPRC
jgi:hypothetical protein